MAGLDVTIVELADHVIAPLDIEMSADVHRYMRHKGVGLILSNGVKEIEEDEEKLIIKLNNGEVETDMVIMAAGVRPETGIAKAAGIDVNAMGSRIVNEHMETSAEDIYAVGDAVEVTHFVTGAKAFIPLAGPANKQGRIAPTTFAV